MLTWGVPSGTLLFIETNPTTKRETMRQNFELGQRVIVNGHSLHPIRSERKHIINVPCVVIGCDFYFSQEKECVEYRVISLAEYESCGLTRDTESYRMAEESLRPGVEVSGKLETEGEHLFIHATHGNHFYGEILHVTDDNIFIRGTSPGNQEMLLNKTGWKVFKEVTV